MASNILSINNYQSLLEVQAGGDEIFPRFLGSRDEPKPSFSPEPKNRNNSKKILRFFNGND